MPALHGVKRRAHANYHQQQPSLPGRLLKRLDSLRSAVIVRGRLRTMLRRIDRYMP